MSCGKVTEGSMWVPEHVHSCARPPEPKYPRCAGASATLHVIDRTPVLVWRSQIPKSEAPEVRRAGKGSSANGFARPARMSTVADPRPGSPSVEDVSPRGDLHLTCAGKAAMLSGA